MSTENNEVFQVDENIFFASFFVRFFLLFRKIRLFTFIFNQQNP